MSLPIVSEKKFPSEARNETDILFDNVSVRYRVPHERVTTLKEHTIRWMQRRNRYNDFWALKAVNLKVQRGDIVGIIGRNGAGKSTLLKVVARVLHPTSGRVVIRGRVAPLLEFGAGFHPELTGRENVFLNGTLLGLAHAEIQAKFNEIIDFAELWDFIDAPLRTYSSGMVARLGFAIATDVEPDILIVDEILGVGDTDFQQKSADRINAFRKRGVTILLVSHNLDAVRNLCDQSVWLENGQVVASGATDQVIESYLNQVSAREEARLVAQDRQQNHTDEQVSILSVRFLDAAGIEHNSFTAGNPMVARIRYRVLQRIEKPVFGVAIFRSDGIHVNGPNTRLANFPIEWIEGEGEVDYIVESLPLLEGTYEFSAAIYDYHCIRPYASQHRAFRFLVRGGTVKETFGLVYIPAHWEHRRL